MHDHSHIASVMETIRRLHFVTSSDDAFREHLDRLLKRDGEGLSIPDPVRFGKTAETRGILYVDSAGSGKTTTVARGLDKHPALQGRRGSFRPFLSSVVPTEPTLKTMAISLLTEAGYALERTRRTTFELFEHLRELMVRNGQVVLWIDEAHDLFCKDKGQILRATKSLMQGDGSVIVIMSGTEMLEDIVCSDPQVRRRFSIIRPAPMELSEHGEKLTLYMEEFCRRADLEPLDGASLPSRLLVASRQRFGRAIELMQNAVEQALLDQAKGLDLWHFGLAWGMQEGPDAESNPFTVDDWHRIDPDALLPEPVKKRRR